MRTSGDGIEVDGLVRDFKGGVRAVDGIDLRVAPGEIYGFLGPNGAGKSTTVLVLTTLLPPTAGQVRVAGLDVVRQGAEVRRAIGASLQESALDPYLTGREHMRLQSALHGLSRAERDARGTTRWPASTRRPPSWTPGGASSPAYPTTPGSGSPARWC
jgi:ABC-2 type transport system ATP-binding protein